MIELRDAGRATPDPEPVYTTRIFSSHILQLNAAGLAGKTDQLPRVFSIGSQRDSLCFCGQPGPRSGLHRAKVRGALKSFSGQIGSAVAIPAEGFHPHQGGALSIAIASVMAMTPFSIAVKGGAGSGTGRMGSGNDLSADGLHRQSLNVVLRESRSVVRAADSYHHPKSTPDAVAGYRRRSARQPLSDIADHASMCVTGVQSGQLS